MRYLWVLLTLLVSGTAQAVDCQTVPSCEELGYTKEVDPNCKENGYISCPFDTAYKKCVNMDCEKMGFTKSDKSSWCASIISCKSDSAMTLCQKPCFATTYEELSSLAGSGKCKVVTMRNDINIPQNRNIVLAANTILDGGGYTLTSSGNRNFSLMHLRDNAGVKNLKIKHDQKTNQSGFSIFTTTGTQVPVYLSDLDIQISSNDSENHTTYAFDKATYYISGNLKVSILGVWHLSFFSWNSITHFSNANLDFSCTGTSCNIFDGEQVYMENTTVTADIKGCAFVNDKKPYGEIMTVDFKNSIAYFKASCFLYHAVNTTPETPLPTLSLEQTEVSYEGNEFLLSPTTAKNNTVTLAGTAEKPTKFTVKDTGKHFNDTHIDAKDLNVSVEINGVTYRPTKVGTTLLSEIENSQNWTRVQ